MRIRSVWPAFWTSLTLAQLTREQRLFFIALITYADDEGRERCDYRLFKAALFPLDEDVTPSDLKEWMDRLVSLRLVIRYGDTFYAIRSWDEHQSPNKPKKSKFPAPPEGTYEERTTTFAVHPTANGNGVREGKGKEGMGEDVGIPDSVLSEASGYLKNPATRTARLGVIRGALQGISDKPVSEAVLARALRDMTAAGTDFRPVVLRTWCERADKEIQGEAGRRAAAGSLVTPSQQDSGWAEDEALS